MHTIFLPYNLSAESAKNFIYEVWAHAKETELGFDFSNVSWVEPYGVLLIALTLKNLNQQRALCSLKTYAVNFQSVQLSSTSALGYLKFIGFFRYVGWDEGNLPGEARGSNTYAPITVISRNQLIFDPELPIQKVIERKSDSLAQMIFDGDNESSQILVSYCFKEIIRNVFEHAQTDECVLMAQYWGGSKNEIEIAIADSGIGIHGSLANVFDNIDTHELLKISLQPGVSRNMHESEDPDNPYQNSGFGLYIVSHLGMDYGKFNLLSSGKGLEVKRSPFKDIIYMPYDVPYSGTAIRLRLSLSNADYFPNQLESYVRNGEKISSQEGRRKTASKSSSSITLF